MPTSSFAWVTSGLVSSPERDVRGATWWSTCRLPSNDEDHLPVTLSEHDAARVINCRSLVDALRRDGALSSQAHAQAIERLGTEGLQRSDAEPPGQRSIVYLVANTTGVLADANLLDLVCNHFETRVDPGYVEEIRREAVNATAADSLREWLRSLVDRVRAGLSTGGYETIRLKDALPELEVPGGKPPTPEVQALRDLLTFATQLGDVIWIDDRYASSFSNRDGVPIVGVLDMLWELRSRSAIDEAQYYETVLQLRASNARYISLTAEEILHHLKDAPISGGRLVETSALATLRRHVAACLLDSLTLQRGPKPQDWSSPYGELDFVFQTLTAVSQALGRCFTEEDSSEIADARADWTFWNLYTGLFGVRELLLADSSGTGLDLIGRDLTVAVWGMLTVFGEKGPVVTERRRAQYMRWLSERLLRKRFKVDPGVILSSALALKSIALDKLSTHSETTPEGVAYRLGLQQIIVEAPEALREEISRDPELCARVGLLTTWTIKVGRVTFQAPEFLRAVAEALNGREATVHAQSADTEFRVRRVSTQGLAPSAAFAVEVSNHQGSIRATVSGPEFRLLRDSPAEREVVLRENRSWFDCAAAEYESAISDVVSTNDPAQRIERLEHYKASSAACYYHRIEETLRTSGRFDIADILPPSASGLLNHFRLDVSHADDRTDFSARLSPACMALVAQEGIEEALARLVCFPIPLPAAAVEELKRVPADERNRILTRLETRCCSPIARPHLIALATTFAGETEVPLAIARRTVDQLFGAENEKEFRLFHAILGRVHSELSDRPGAKGWPPSVKLPMAWAHSAKLQDILRPADADKLAEWIQQAAFQIGSEPFSRQPEVWNDALHPRLLRREDILTSGLASVLQGCSPEGVASLQISDRVRSVLLCGRLGPEFPSVSLLKDPCLAANCSGSILGGDRAAVLRGLVAADVCEAVSSGFLQGAASRALELLKHDFASPHAWMILSGVVCDLPIYAELREEVRSLLAAIDLEALWLRDALSGFLAIGFGAGQAAHLEDDALRAKVEQMLIRVATHLDGRKKQASETGGSLSVDRHALNLIEAALRVTHYPGDDQKTGTRLAELLVKLLNASPVVCEYLRSTVGRLVFEIPAEQLHGIWQVELELRARSAGA